MFRSVQVKLVILLSILTVFFVTGLVFMMSLERNRSQLMFREREQAAKVLFYKLVDLNGSSLKAFAFDYTFWDEMIKFVSTGNKKWAVQNIDTALSTFKANAVWVCRTDFSLIYSVNNIKDEKSKELPLPKEAFGKIFKDGYFQHFFVNIPDGLIEICTAPIQPSSDSARKTPARGYFFAGRLWNKGNMDELANLTETSLKILSAAATPKETRDWRTGLTIFSTPFSGWDGSTLAWLQVKKEFPTIVAYNESIDFEFIGLTIFMLVILVLPTLFLARWVTAPLSLLSGSLNKGDPAAMKDLQNEKSEFGSLAQLVAISFEQKTELLKEIEERKQAEKKVLERSGELEDTIKKLEATSKELSGKTIELQEKMKELKDFHDLAVGREIKMIEMEKEVNFLLAKLGREPKYR